MDAYWKQLKYLWFLKTRIDKLQRLSLMDYLLSIDEVTGLLYGVQGRLKISIPRIKPFISELFTLVDGNNACKPVDFSTNPVIDHHVTKLILGTLDWDANKLTHSSEADTAVVLLNHSKVVLNKLPYQLNQVILVVESALLKRFEDAHLLCNYVFLQGHQFKGQELAHILREQLVLFKFTGV